MKDFVLDMTGILEDPKVQEDMGKINSKFKLALGGAYSPILANFEKMYLSNEETPEARDRLAKDIMSHFKRFAPKEKINTNIDIQYEKGAQGILRFVLQGLENGKSIKEIMEGYEHNGVKRAGIGESFEKLFFEDFQRTSIKVIDQKGKVIYENLHSKIYNDLAPDKLSVDGYKKKLKEYLNLTDQELQTYVSRVTQYSATGNGLMFQPSNVVGLSTQREDILRVSSDENDKITHVESFESITRASAYEIEKGVIIGEDTKPFYTMTNKIFFSKEGSGVSLPTQGLQELIIFEAHTDAAKVDLDPALQIRTLENIAQNCVINSAVEGKEMQFIQEFFAREENPEKYLSQAILLSLCQAAIIPDSGLGFDEKTKTKLISSFIKKEIEIIKNANKDEDKDERKDINNKELAEKIIERMPVLTGLNVPDEKITAALKPVIENYIEQKSSITLSSFVDYIKSCSMERKFLSTEEYREVRLKKQIQEIRADLESRGVKISSTISANNTPNMPQRGEVLGH